MLQIAATEQELVQERQAVQRLDGETVQLRQDLESSSNQLEEQREHFLHEMLQ